MLDCHLPLAFLKFKNIIGIETKLILQKIKK